jgi:hypothetical protein
MRTWTKVLSGLGAFTPLVSAVGLGAYIAIVLVLDDIDKGGPARDPISLIANGPFDANDLVVFAVLVGAITLFQMAMAAILSVHAARDPRLSGGRLVLWIFGLLFFGAFAQPLYFLVYVLREPVRRVDLPAIG